MAKRRGRPDTVVKGVRSAPREQSTFVPRVLTGVWWRASLLVLAGLFVYWNSFSGPFVFDDIESIVENHQIRSLWRFADVLAPERELPTAGRPLVNASFAINYALGGLDVRGYHAWNLGVHLACALLLFGVVRRTLQMPALRARFGAHAIDLAFAVALLWAIHPLNTEVVDYLTQRTESMMGLCYLATLYASLRAAVEPSWRWPVLAVTSCAAGMACKESMVTAPVMVALYDRGFVFSSMKDAIAARWRLYAGLASTWILLALLLRSGPRIHSAGFSTGVSAWTYLLNQTVMITRYVRLSVWPRALVVTYGWPVSLTLGDVLPQALFVAALLAAAVIALVRKPALGFAGAWFFLTLAPTSSVVPIATEVGAERRMYLPLIALVSLAVIGSAALWSVIRQKARRRARAHV